MPIYEFRCGGCSESFSVLVLSSRSDPPACPSCGSTDVSKLVSAFSCNVDAGGGAAAGGGGFTGGT